MAHYWESRPDTADPAFSEKPLEKGAEVDAVDYVEELRNDGNHLV